ncbi:PTS glucose transporter subunit IIA [Gilliamella sp. wkB171]|uniref:PTS glucose transporter subunit IIA n=1 Tax=Gilliamella sp. wkB171 TaxID=3120258 RepID=UPI0009E3EC7C|nr:PTS glucose transporter subunit IIA [Gilliamella apicola]
MGYFIANTLGSISELGDELLIYIGQETVALEGKYFKAFINTGDKIKKAITHSIRYQ